MPPPPGRWGTWPRTPNGLLLAPFAYLPLSDGEVRSLFAAVAESTSLPVCFYNKPLQTRYDLRPQTLAFLAENATVVAVKETMRREDIAGRVQQLRDSVGAAFLIGLSSDVQLLAQLPGVGAWHSGMAALLPDTTCRCGAKPFPEAPKAPNWTACKPLPWHCRSCPMPWGRSTALQTVWVSPRTAPGVPLPLPPRKNSRFCAVQSSRSLCPVKGETASQGCLGR
ncbi:MULTISPECIES: dihydrodipicolinate synthase family protein [Arthrobacter]|uniref:dihydrodipicolinate synthase family protein n=1 Tax=Arthrobacter TaxID=1663 RepID=UPI0009EB4551